MNYIIPEKDNLYYDAISFSLPYVDGKNVSLQELLLRFQDIAGRHIETLGFGDDYRHEHHMMYILCRMKLEFLRPIKENEPLTFVTYPTKVGILQFYRYAYLLDKEGKPVLHLSSLWVLLNSETRRLMSSKDFSKDFEKVLPDIGSFEPLIPGKLQALDFTDLTLVDSGTYEVGKEDIDKNLHMNNTVYMKIVQQQGLHKPVMSIDIDFEKECYLLEKINVRKVETDQALSVEGYKEDGSLSFRCQIGY